MDSERERWGWRSKSVRDRERRTEEGEVGGRCSRIMWFGEATSTRDLIAGE